MTQGPARLQRVTVARTADRGSGPFPRMHGGVCPAAEPGLPRAVSEQGANGRKCPEGDVGLGADRTRTGIRARLTPP